MLTEAHAWIYTNGLSINLDGSEDNTPVRAISVQKPFEGSTTRGFRLGDSREKFLKLYTSFPDILVYDDSIQIRLRQSIYLNVHLDKGGQADDIYLVRNA